MDNRDSIGSTNYHNNITKASVCDYRNRTYRYVSTTARVTYNV